MTEEHRVITTLFKLNIVFRRNTESRLSRCSQATVESVRSRCSQLTVDSGRYSHVTVDSDRYGHTTADSGRYSDASKVSNVTGGQRSFIPRYEKVIDFYFLFLFK